MKNIVLFIRGAVWGLGAVLAVTIVGGLLFKIIFHCAPSYLTHGMEVTDICTPNGETAYLVLLWTVLLSLLLFPIIGGVWNILRKNKNSGKPS